MRGVADLWPVGRVRSLRVENMAKQVSSVHLIAGNQVTDRYLAGGLIAVCGAVAGTPSYSPDADPTYCPDCVTAALDWNQRADGGPRRATRPVVSISHSR